MKKSDLSKTCLEIECDAYGRVLLNRSVRRKRGRAYHFTPFKPVSGLFPASMSWPYIMELYQDDSRKSRFIRSFSQKSNSENDARAWFEKLPYHSLSLKEIEAFLSEQFYNLLRQKKLSVRSLSFRRMIQRFGRCDTHGNIALSHYLIFLPAHQREYVMLHEMTHLIHPHHQKAFWNKLESFFPNAIETHQQTMKWGPRFRLFHQQASLHNQHLKINTGTVR
jgi:hypothetical protein